MRRSAPRLAARRVNFGAISARVWAADLRLSFLDSWQFGMISSAGKVSGFSIWGRRHISAEAHEIFEVAAQKGGYLSASSP